MKDVKFGWGYIAIGVLLSLVGICFISFNNALNILAISIGVLLAVFGIFFGAVTLSKTDRSVSFALKIVLSIMCIICGTVTAILQDGAVMIMANIFCLLLIVDGAFKLQTAILSKRYRVASWWIMLVTSVVIILSAFLLAKLSPENTATFTVLSGIIILVDGAANLFSAFYITKYETQMEIEAYREYGVRSDSDEDENEDEEAEKPAKKAKRKAKKE